MSPNPIPILVPLLLSETLPAPDSVAGSLLQYGVLGIVCFYLIVDRAYERRRQDKKDEAAIARQDARELAHLEKLSMLSDSISALGEAQLLTLAANKQLGREFQDTARDTLLKNSAKSRR